MRSVIKRERVRVEDGTCPANGGQTLSDACAGTGTPRPGLRLVEANGRVHAIEVTCRCGEVSLIELEYDPAEEDTPRGE